MNNLPAVLETNEIVQPEQFSAFGSLAHFETAQRMAKALCSSTIVPETYRGQEKIGDCMIALEIANRIGATVLAVMQNLYIVHGRPAWSSQFLISCLNASRRFSPLRYKLTAPGAPQKFPYSYTIYQNGAKVRKEGEIEIRDQTCVAWATDRTGQLLESPPVSIAMAVAEGWYTKDGSKWKTMPELMLRYRAATFFTRLYAPEMTMGIQSEDEVVDIQATVTSSPVAPAKALFGEVPPVASLPAPAASTPAPPSAGTKETINYVKGVRGLVKLANISEPEFLDFARASYAWDDSLTSFDEVAMVSPSKLQAVYEDWNNVLKAYNKAAGK